MKSWENNENDEDIPPATEEFEKILENPRKVREKETTSSKERLLQIISSTACKIRVEACRPPPTRKEINEKPKCAGQRPDHFSC